MKNQYKTKRITIYMPIYLLKEVDKTIKITKQTRSDFFIEALENLLEKRKLLLPFPR